MTRSLLDEAPVRAEARNPLFLLGLAFMLVAALAALATTPPARPGDARTDAPPPLVEPPSEPGPFYTAENRPTFEVHTQAHTLKGGEHARDLPVRVYLPIVPAGRSIWSGGVADAGGSDGGSAPGVPVIVFSHGLGGSNEAFPAAAELWASHGYVVLLPTHADSMKLRENRRAILTGRRPGAGVLQQDRFRDRALDQTRILDSIDELCNAIPRLAALRDAHGIDSNNVATAGHSFGAQTCQVVAGAELRTDAGVSVRSPDPRVRACAPISPQAIGSAGFFAGSWDRIAVPVFIVTGTHDEAIDGARPEQRQDGFRALAEGQKYLLNIHNAHHSSFQRKPEGISRRNQRRFYERMGVPYSANDAARDEAIALHTRTVLLAFFDAYLRQDGAALEYLESEDPAHAGGSTGTYERK